MVIRSVTLADAAKGTVVVRDKDSREWRRDPSSMLDDRLDDVVAELAHQTSLPVIQTFWRKCRVEQHLHSRIRNGADRIGDRRSETPERR